MKRKYLGDSYDAIKRMWQELLADWAPLHAEPRFIPDNLRQDFTRLTKIDMLPDHPLTPYFILNDPDTGIRLPSDQAVERNQAEGCTHISTKTIIGQIQKGARCVVTFDQSHYRGIGLKLDDQLRAKMQVLADEGFHSFYYVSHARFLFAFQNQHDLQIVGRILKNAGIPQNRIETL